MGASWGTEGDAKKEGECALELLSGIADANALFRDKAAEKKGKEN